MTRRVRILALVTPATIIVCGILFYQFLMTPSSPSRPTPTAPSVTGTTDENLTHLFNTLDTFAPTLSRKLNPGLSEAEIASLEQQYNVKLSQDLQALYRHHNGFSDTSTLDGLHTFPPLATVLAERKALHDQVAAEPALQRAVYFKFAGYSHNWLTIFPDPAGDGYYFDPSIANSPGEFFYHFREDSSYFTYPSLRNFLREIATAYESKIITLDPTTGRHLVDHDKLFQLRYNYSTPNHSPLP